MDAFQVKKYKKDFDYSYAFGSFPTIELLKNKPERVLKICVRQKSLESAGFEEIDSLAKKHNIEILVSDKSINRISSAENIYSVGVFTKYESGLNADENHLVLHNPDDMGNLGTILRTMLGFGITNIALIKPAVDIFDPKVIRSSMGAVFQINFEYFDSFDEYKAKYKNIIYPFVLEGKNILGKVNLQTPYSLVFGNEGSGLPKEFNDLETSITIDHGNKIDSLNLSISVGISLYEASKSA